MLKIFSLILGLSLSIVTSNAQESSEIPEEILQRVDTAMNRLEQFAGLNEEQYASIEPMMLLQARVIIQNIATPLETRQTQLEELLETTRLQIEPLLTETQKAGFGMVWNQVSQQVMEKLE